MFVQDEPPADDKCIRQYYVKSPVNNATNSIFHKKLTSNVIFVSGKLALNDPAYFHINCKYMQLL